ncbi:MAG TPA: hypothetical protein VNM40_04265 [Candidatus Paceibacterota bacterium]|nr:hypothetical protein [Candidatus Paceibacterota bacterium]
MWIILLVGLIFPRLASAILCFFTNWFDGVFLTWYWPLLGFIFMPYTMLWYSAAINWYGGEWQFFQIAVLVIAIIADVSSSGKTARG